MRCRLLVEFSHPGDKGDLPQQREVFAVPVQITVVRDQRSRLADECPEQGRAANVSAPPVKNDR